MPDYTIPEAQHILGAYRTVFSDHSLSVSVYLDIGPQRQREWSCLTTNFYDVTLDAIEQFDRAVRNANINEMPKNDLGQYFRQLSIEHNIGYSLGISPWTDYLLHKSFTPELKKIVIILGHDWYPLIPENLQIWDSINPPLRQCPITGSYDEAIPNLFKNGEFILFFMNLFPDFREPFASKTGSLGNADFYKPFVEGFEAVCDAIAENYEIAALIVWGSDVWTALKSKIASDWQQRGFIETIKYQHQCHNNGIPITLGEGTYKAFPLPHPAYFQANCTRTFKGIYGTAFIQGIDSFITKCIK